MPRLDSTVLDRLRRDTAPRCEWPECSRPAVMTIEGDTETLRACPNHVHELLIARGRHLRGVPRRCLACGAVRAETFNANVTDYEASLCAEHLTAFLNHDLDPKAFRRLAKDAGDPERVHDLHGDFYSPRGRALQPMEGFDVGMWARTPGSARSDARSVRDNPSPSESHTRPPQR
jgi:hypothetical protein